MSDEISDLRLFVRMATAGSLSETARRLNSSLPAMSRRLSAMEARLGVRLFDRNTRHFALTDEGSRFFERAVAILADLDAAEAELAANVSAPQGHIRVGAPLEIGRRRIGPLIAEFSKQYPRVSVELVLSDSQVDLVGNELDVGLLIEQPTDGSMISRQLISSRRVVCASPEYVAQHGVPAVPDDLLQHDCICLVRGRHIFDRWSFTEDNKPREIQVKGTLLTNNGEVLHGWTLMGRGVGLKALWDIKDDLKQGRLIELLPSFAHNVINLYAIYPTRTHLPPRTRVFVDFVVASMKDPV
ncbi:LysR family transcriptional regulator [Pararobbsia alpina]|uniref:HTH-type transcriptional regulator DmlR n=1 Tax=Pararobbsia alpina TaxID=621374 RepID=A0A6S7CWX7_9BURK|nr:LysR family transcriptional regulator [Pararobbsia alpina]CAB3790142.1 HTH-type transcriptional regulator DmlR [Pararobbsia alpina]